MKYCENTNKQHLKSDANLCVTLDNGLCTTPYTNLQFYEARTIFSSVAASATLGRQSGKIGTLLLPYQENFVENHASEAKTKIFLLCEYEARTKLIFHHMEICFLDIF